MTPEHLIIAPILIPFFAGALMLLYGHESQRKARLALSFISAVALLLVALELLERASRSPTADGGALGFYLLGDWATPYSIVLVLDRLSALMLVVASTVTLGVLVFAIGQGVADGDDTDTPLSIFHPTYLVLVAGVSNAFLAGDLFNLYVGFEVLLAASYVLLTLGGTAGRIRARWCGRGSPSRTTRSAARTGRCS